MKGIVMNILFADDSRLIREKITSLLEGFGHTVVAVQDGQELLDRLEAAPDYFDLIITDNNMPRVEGLDVLRRCKGDARLERVPIIVYSASNAIQGLVEYLGERFVDKCGSINHLLAAIDEACAKR